MTTSGRQIARAFGCYSQEGADSVVRAAAFCLECDKGISAEAVAEPVSSLEGGDLLRYEGGETDLRRDLRVHVGGEVGTAALSAVDWTSGTRGEETRIDGRTIEHRMETDSDRSILKKGYWIKRTKRHCILAVVAIAMTVAVYFATPPPDFRHRLSMGTAYAGLALFAFSLWLGPWNVLRWRPNPVSFDFRRDVGIWAAVLALVHTGVGLTVHLRGRMWMYFFKHLHPLTLQNSEFGFANYVGLGAAVLFLILLAISNDVSLRRLGTRQWKNIQRWAYVAFALTVAHGIAYQLIEERHRPWVIVYAAIILAVIVIQALGWNRRRLRAAG